MVLDADLDGSVSAVSGAIVSTNGGVVRAVYENAFNGFWAEMTESEAKAVASHPDVLWVEENEQVWITGTQSTTPDPSPGTEADLQYLDRVDQVEPGGPSQRFDNAYSYCNTGSGVRIYVVDTGVRPDAATPAGGSEFGSRVDTAPALRTYLLSRGFTVSPQCWEPDSRFFTPAAAHGTAVASVAAGNMFGIAKGATIVDARAFDCHAQASTARVAAVLDWILVDPNRGTKSVVNMSFTYSKYEPGATAIETALSSLSGAGVISVASAGNANSDTYWYIPARTSSVITVGGMAKFFDAKWTYSNWGNEIDIFAQAQYVEAATTMNTPTYRSNLDGCADYQQDNCTSGTSFSAPAVAGVVARYLQYHSGATLSQIKSWMNAVSAEHNGNVISGSWGSARILNVGECP